MMFSPFRMYSSYEPMDDEVIHPPSMTRAIAQPGYLNQMKDFPSDEHTFHTTTLMLLRQFIDKLKVFHSKVEVLSLKHVQSVT